MEEREHTQSIADATACTVQTARLMVDFSKDVDNGTTKDGSRCTIETRFICLPNTSDSAYQTQLATDTDSTGMASIVIRSGKTIYRPYSEDNALVEMHRIRNLIALRADGILSKQICRNRNSRRLTSMYNGTLIVHSMSQQKR